MRRRVIQCYICDFCGVTFKRRGYLVTHIFKIHLKSEQSKLSCLKCDYCESYFKNNKRLSYHLMKCHINIEEEKPNVESQNDLGFNDILAQAIGASRLDFVPNVDIKKITILVSNGVRMIKCDYCQYKTTRLSLLKRHILSHNSAKLFQCPLCPSRVAYLSNLKKHMSTVHDPSYGKRKRKSRKLIKVRTQEPPIELENDSIGINTTFTSLDNIDDSILNDIMKDIPSDIMPCNLGQIEHILNNKNDIETSQMKEDNLVKKFFNLNMDVSQSGKVSSNSGLLNNDFPLNTDSEISAMLIDGDKFAIDTSNNDNNVIQIVPINLDSDQNQADTMPVLYRVDMTNLPSNMNFDVNTVPIILDGIDINSLPFIEDNINNLEIYTDQNIEEHSKNENNKIIDFINNDDILPTDGNNDSVRIVPKSLPILDEDITEKCNIPNFNHNNYNSDITNINNSLKTSVLSNTTHSVAMFLPTILEENVLDNCTPNNLSNKDYNKLKSSKVTVESNDTITLPIMDSNSNCVARSMPIILGDNDTIAKPTNVNHNEDEIIEINNEVAIASIANNVNVESDVNMFNNIQDPLVNESIDRDELLVSQENSNYVGVDSQQNSDYNIVSNTNLINDHVDAATSGSCSKVYCQVFNSVNYGVSPYNNTTWSTCPIDNEAYIDYSLYQKETNNTSLLNSTILSNSTCSTAQGQLKDGAVHQIGNEANVILETNGIQSVHTEILIPERLQPRDDMHQISNDANIVLENNRIQTIPHMGSYNIDNYTDILIPERLQSRDYMPQIGSDADIAPETDTLQYSIPYSDCYDKEITTEILNPVSSNDVSIQVRDTQNHIDNFIDNNFNLIETATAISQLNEPGVISEIIEEPSIAKNGIDISETVREQTINDAGNVNYVDDLNNLNLLRTMDSPEIKNITFTDIISQDEDFVNIKVSVDIEPDSLTNVTNTILQEIDGNKSKSEDFIIETIKALNNKSKKFLCQICFKEFHYARNLVAHISMVHERLNYICDYCDTVLHSKKSLIVHVKSHLGPRKVKCKVCSALLRPSSMPVHMRLHKNEKPFLCKQCGRKFTTSSQINCHIRKHHLKPYSLPASSPTLIDMIGDICDIQAPAVPVNCIKSLIDKQQVITKTVKKKSYTCDVCKKEFNDGGNMARHKKLHFREKSFVCDCGAAFVNKQALAMHKYRYHPIKRKKVN